MIEGKPFSNNTDGKKRRFDARGLYNQRILIVMVGCGVGSLVLFKMINKKFQLHLMQWKSLCVVLDSFARKARKFRVLFSFTSFLFFLRG